MTPRWGLRRVDGGIELVEPNTGELLSAQDLAEIRAAVWWFDDLLGEREVVTA